MCILAGALSGCLLAAALPPANQWWLGPLCLVPVLVAVRGAGLLRGFLGGISVPVAAVAIISSGLLYPGPASPGNPKWVWVGCGFFGFLIAIVCCVQAETKLTGWRRTALLAATAVGLEFSLFPILPAHLALTQYRMPGMMMLAGIGGIWLVSLLLWFANAAFTEALSGRRYRLGAVAAGLLALGYGLALWPHGIPGHTVRVAAVQTDETDIQTLRDLNARAGRQGAALAVWPEFSGIEGAPGGNPSGLCKLSSQVGEPPYVTSYRDAFEPLPHNTAALFSAGSCSAVYYKRKVFGGERNMHTPGTKPVAVDWPGHGRLGMNICYDSCYPRVLGETAGLSGVSLIALPTIDPDSPNGFVAAVHAAFTPFRAAESGTPIVRAVGTAYSTMVDGYGRIAAEMGPGTNRVLIADLPLGRRWTLYSVLGDWVLYLCLGYVALELGVAIRSWIRIRSQ